MDFPSAHFLLFTMRVCCWASYPSLCPLFLFHFIFSRFSYYGVSSYSHYRFSLLLAHFPPISLSDFIFRFLMFSRTWGKLTLMGFLCLARAQPACLAPICWFLHPIFILCGFWWADVILFFLCEFSPLRTNFFTSRRSSTCSKCHSLGVWPPNSVSFVSFSRLKVPPLFLTFFSDLFVCVLSLALVFVVFCLFFFPLSCSLCVFLLCLQCASSAISLSVGRLLAYPLHSFSRVLCWGRLARVCGCYVCRMGVCACVCLCVSLFLRLLSFLCGFFFCLLCVFSFFVRFSSTCTHFQCRFT